MSRGAIREWAGRAKHWLRGGKRWPKVWREWRFNVGLGIVVSVVLAFFAKNPLAVKTTNAAVDKTMTLKASMSTSAPSGMPLVAIDVDEETWRDPSWGGGAPARAPREPLLKLIKYAVGHKAKYTIVDVIIEGDDQENCKFAEDIHALAGSLEEQQHLFFVRTLLRPTWEEPLPVWRFSPLDKFQDPPFSTHVHFVAPYFRLSNDGVVREWTLWRAGCQRPDAARGTGHWAVLPSVQIAVAAIETGAYVPKSGNLWDGIGGGIACGNDLPTPDRRAKEAPKRPEVRDAERERLVQTRDDTEKGIDEWLWRWLAVHSELSGNNTLRRTEEESVDPKNRILFKFGDRPAADVVGRISARNVIGGGADTTSMAGAAVVIGQSFEDARDNHPTPLGPMSGFMVILNSISSMLSPQLIRELSTPVEVVIELFLIGLIGFAFARFESNDLASLILGVGLVPLTAGLSYLLLTHGWWWDYGVPIMSIGVHRSFESAVGLVRRQKHSRKSSEGGS